MLQFFVYSGRGHVNINIETLRHGNMETWKHGNMATWQHGVMRMETCS
jgi:hypothetical protein